ncbi:MAG: hypothetical protein O2779_01485 [Nanoarchaeota archaeon]|nr:hypothetical protein [Nanoarchaeota archaeon]
MTIQIDRRRDVLENDLLGLDDLESITIEEFDAEAETKNFGSKKITKGIQFRDSKEFIQGILQI